MASPVVYVVDDDESVRKALGRLFRSAGYDAKVFASAEEFLGQSSEDGPRCLVLDVRMPEIDGFELQRRLRASGSRIPIVFITAHYDTGIRQQVIDAGAVDYIQKPFDDEALLNAVRTGLELVDLS